MMQLRSLVALLIVAVVLDSCLAGWKNPFKRSKRSQQRLSKPEPVQPGPLDVMDRNELEAFMTDVFHNLPRYVQESFGSSSNMADLFGNDIRNVLEWAESSQSMPDVVNNQDRQIVALEATSVVAQSAPQPDEIPEDPEPVQPGPLDVMDRIELEACMTDVFNNLPRYAQEFFASSSNMADLFCNDIRNVLEWAESSQSMPDAVSNRDRQIVALEAASGVAQSAPQPAEIPEETAFLLIDPSFEPEPAVVLPPQPVSPPAEYFEYLKQLKDLDFTVLELPHVPEPSAFVEQPSLTDNQPSVSDVESCVSDEKALVPTMASELSNFDEQWSPAPDTETYLTNFDEKTNLNNFNDPTTATLLCSKIGCKHSNPFDVCFQSQSSSTTSVPPFSDWQMQVFTPQGNTPSADGVSDPVFDGCNQPASLQSQNPFDY